MYAEKILEYRRAGARDGKTSLEVLSRRDWYSVTTKH